MTVLSYKISLSLPVIMDSSGLFQSKQMENGCLQPSTQNYGVTMQKMCADSIVMSLAHSLFVHV
jgi:hypothetical protein